MFAKCKYCGAGSIDSWSVYTFKWVPQAWTGFFSIQWAELKSMWMRKVCNCSASSTCILRPVWGNKTAANSWMCCIWPRPRLPNATVIYSKISSIYRESLRLHVCGAIEGWECRIPRWKWLISVGANEGSQFDSFEFVLWMLLSCVTATPLSGRHLNSFSEHHLHSLPATAIIPPCDTFFGTQIESLASCWWKPHLLQMSPDSRARNKPSLWFIYNLTFDTFHNILIPVVSMGLVFLQAGFALIWRKHSWLWTVWGLVITFWL